MKKIFILLFFAVFACREKQTLVDIVTEKGTITIKLYEKEAPKTCKNFLKLV